MKKCCFIGLGYIGLPSALLFAESGFEVLGVDIKEEVIKNLNSGRSHINEPFVEKMLKDSINQKKLIVTNKPTFADAFFITVPTPIINLNGKKEPNLQFVYTAINSIIPYIKEGNMIILESTSPVGTTDNICELILEKTGFKKEDIFIAYCPERVLPGNIIYELKNNDRIIGGINSISSSKICKLYENICNSKIRITDSRTAELVKIVENSYRDLNIAFANELSILADELDINVYELISFTNNHPRVSILKPSCGVGGHGIAVDPWFLISQYPEQTKISRLARDINISKTKWVIQKVEKYIKNNFGNSNVKIGIFGITYKPNVNDLRESPSLIIANYFLEKYQVNICEPNLNKFKDLKIDSLENTIKSSDILIFLVGHDEFKNIDIKDKKSFDFCGILEDE